MYLYVNIELLLFCLRIVNNDLVSPRSVADRLHQCAGSAISAPRGSIERSLLRSFETTELIESRFFAKMPFIKLVVKRHEMETSRYYF